MGVALLCMAGMAGCAAVPSGERTAVPAGEPAAGSASVDHSPTARSSPTASEAGEGADTMLVRRIQALLAAEGYDVGEIDGILDRRSRSAIIEYQADRGLPVDGVAGRDLLRHLVTTVDDTPPREASAGTSARAAHAGPTRGASGGGWTNPS